MKGKPVVVVVCSLWVGSLSLSCVSLEHLSAHLLVTALLRALIQTDQLRSNPFLYRIRDVAVCLRREREGEKPSLRLAFRLHPCFFVGRQMSHCHFLSLSICYIHPGYGCFPFHFFIYIQFMDALTFTSGKKIIFLFLLLLTGLFTLYSVLHFLHSPLLWFFTYFHCLNFS